MKIITKGKCLKCGEIYSPKKAADHLLLCSYPNSTSGTLSDGYLIKVSSKEASNIYWMFITLSKDTSLLVLDEFLRDIWLECCGHLSEFIFRDQRIISHSESGNISKVMKKQIRSFVSHRQRFGYVYDMGSSTELTLSVIEDIPVNSPKNIITLLMRNKAPTYLCESCNKSADIICTFCGQTICNKCQNKHSCTIDEGDTYMLMPIINSPRTGVCAYGS